MHGAAACFHCAETVPAGSAWTADIDGALRRFCCAGCVAVARTIHGAGLDAYYRNRPAPAATPSRAAEQGAWARDNAIAQRAGLLHVRADGSADAALLIEGLTCGACVWLLESWLARVEGVREVRVNLALRRAQVRFDPRRLTLAPLLEAAAAVGYAAHPYDPVRREALARREARALLRRTVLAWLAMMQVMMLALPAYLGDEGVSAEQRRLLDWASLTLTLPVLLYCAAPFFLGAWRSLRARRLGMDVPVAIALAGAFAGSLAATVSASGVTYYDSITMFVALLLTARALELRARQRAAAALELTARALPASAERYAAWPDRAKVESVGADVLVRDDVVLVRPGATVPADACVVEGTSQVDESWLTGESLPRPRSVGDALLAGSINRDSVLIARVVRTGDDTEIATLTRLVQNAADARPPLAQLADRVAAGFVTAMLVLAAGTAIYWLDAEPARALAITFAVLAVSCPCALSLATPAALAAAAGALARRQIVLTRPEALETLARVTTLAFDKTGTLTAGRPRLTDLVALRAISRERVLTIAAALEQGSEHPIARAIVEAADEVKPASGVTMSPGRGVEGDIDGARWRIGRPDFVGVHDADLAAIPSGCTVVALGDAQGPVALLGFADAPRDDALAAVRSLGAQGIGTHVLSGDRQATVDATARALAIDIARGELAPHAKRDAIDALRAEGRIVGMVGDGVNDAPALAAAHVAISLGSATPLAQCTADVVVLGERLRDIPAAVALARRARRIVRENLAWALAYNAAAIPAAAAGLVTPLVASIGMSLSSLVVIANALRAGRMPAA
jgi:Cu2+-exporting ATPase